MTHIVIAALEHFIKTRGSQKAAAKDSGISESYLCHIMYGMRDIPDAVAARAGWRREVTWVGIETPTPPMSETAIGEKS